MFRGQKNVPYSFRNTQGALPLSKSDHLVAQFASPAIAAIAAIAALALTPDATHLSCATHLIRQQIIYEPHN
jgi:hypothetical protein